jgi:hypothetical protein
MSDADIEQAKKLLEKHRKADDKYKAKKREYGGVEDPNSRRWATRTFNIFSNFLSNFGVEEYEVIRFQDWVDGNIRWDLEEQKWVGNRWEINTTAGFKDFVWNRSGTFWVWSKAAHGTKFGVTVVGPLDDGKYWAVCDTDFSELPRKIIEAENEDDGMKKGEEWAKWAVEEVKRLKGIVDTADDILDEFNRGEITTVERDTRLRNLDR